jgi:hypothetical protein
MEKPKRKDFKNDNAFKRALDSWRKRNQPLKPDELDIDLLSQGPAFVQKLIADDPDIKILYDEAVEKGWLDPGNQRGKTLFQNSIMDSDWWKTRSDDAKRAWALERTNKAEFDDRINNAREQIKRLVAQQGFAPLTEDRLNELARDWLYKGWDKEANRLELDNVLSREAQFGTGQRGGMLGQAGRIQDNLRTIAEANGLTLNNNYFESAARSISTGLRTEEDFQRELREQAAGMWPSISEQIRAGMTVKDIASGYINMIASEFEIDPQSIGLDNPYIMKALGAVGPDGRMQQMSLWDFRTKLREDPRWMETSKAQNEMAGIAQQVLRTFGMVGS